MNSPPLDWRSLALPGAVAAIALLLLLGAAYGGSWWLDERAREYQRARSDLARAANQYRSASDDKAVYEQYASRFRELETSGVIGTEHRLSWVEALQAANKRLKLPTLRYEVSPRTMVALENAPFDPARFSLHRSEMLLRFGALHEGDVLRLLEALARDGNGLMNAVACKMTWSGGNGDRDVRYRPSNANLEVGCSVRWYTLQIEREGGT